MTTGRARQFPASRPFGTGDIDALHSLADTVGRHDPAVASLTRHAARHMEQGRSEQARASIARGHRIAARQPHLGQVATHLADQHGRLAAYKTSDQDPVPPPWEQ